MPVLIGTSGWHYQHWRGGLYPASVPAARWLEHYAGRFATVEVNNAFYRLPERSTFATWAATLPDDFVVAVKASRYLTHVKRLRDPEEPVGRLCERMSGLGDRQGPVLLQLPPNLRIDLEALDATLAAFPAGMRVAVEVRHDSWFVAATERLLTDHRAALCLTDTDNRRAPMWRTAPWGYVRFHHGRARPDSCYGRQALERWAQDLAQMWPATADVFAFFNNDGHGCAPRDAHRFALACGRSGLDPTRAPTAREAPLTGD